MKKSLFLAIAAVFLVPIIAHAAVSPVSDISVRDLTIMSGTIDFTPPDDHISNDEYYYNYRLMDSDSDIVDTTVEGPFVVRPLRAGTTHTFYIKAIQLFKNWNDSGTGYVPEQVDESELSDPIEITTPGSPGISSIPTPKISQYGKLVYGQYPWARIYVTYTVHELDGTQVGHKRTARLDHIYGNGHLNAYDFVKHKAASFYEDSSTYGRVYVGANDEGSLMWWANNLDQGGVATIDGSVAPSSFASLSYYRFGKKITAGKEYVMFDEDDEKYIHVKVNKVRVGKAAPPSVFTQLKDKGTAEATPRAKWQQSTFDNDDVDSFIVWYRCTSCSDMSLRQGRRMEVPVWEHEYYSRHLPYTLDEVSGERISYVVRTIFTSGKRSTWSLPASIHVE